MNFKALALAASIALGGVAIAPEAKADSCHNVAMRAVDIATYADSYRDARRFQSEMDVYINMNCGDRTNIANWELQDELRLLRRGMNFICSKGLASGC